ncbi:hypothetical protein C8024_10580 [Sphingopyxis sp. BSNA05]|nr:hypothetical protein [Sphingopyxis sp. BSNA05]
MRLGLQIRFLIRVFGTEIDMGKAAHLRCGKTVAMVVEPAFQLGIRGVVRCGCIADQKVHFLRQPPPDDRVAFTQTQSACFADQHLFLHILVDDLLPVLAGRQPSRRARPDFLQPVDFCRTHDDCSALLALPDGPEMVDGDQRQSDQDKMRDRITKDFHVIYPVESGGWDIPDGR